MTPSTDPDERGFPHPALALGDNAHAPQRIGMTDRRQRQPASDETPHAIPKDAAVLAPGYFLPSGSLGVIWTRRELSLGVTLERSIFFARSLP